MGAPLKEKRKIRTDTYIELDSYEKITKLAKKKELPRARIIEKAVEEYLERHKDELND